MTIAVARERVRVRNEQLRAADVDRATKELWEDIDAGIADSIEDGEPFFETEYVAHRRLVNRTVDEYTERGFAVKLRSSPYGTYITVSGWAAQAAAAAA